MTTFDPPPRESQAIASVSESEAYCQRFTHAHRENFVVVSFLLPKRLRQDFCNLYTYCRGADDLADEIESAAESLRQLDLWQRQLES